MSAKRSPLRMLFRGCLIILGVVVLLAVLIFGAIQAEIIGLDEVLAFAVGLADVGSVNLTDETHLFYIGQIDGDDGGHSPLRTYSLDEMGYGNVLAIPGDYIVEFYASEEESPFFVDAPPVAVCNFHVGRSEEWLFAITSDGVVINAGEGEEDLGEFFVTNSSICGN